MKAVSRDDAPVVIDGNGVEVRLQEMGGGMTASFIRLPAGADLGPALKGLGDGSCPCPHWGYIIRGRLRMRASGSRTPGAIKTTPGPSHGLRVLPRPRPAGRGQEPLRPGSFFRLNQNIQPTPDPEQQASHFDTIVVGGGSAAAVFAVAVRRPAVPDAAEGTDNVAGLVVKAGPWAPWIG
jgi:hypothetical protein